MTKKRLKPVKISGWIAANYGQNQYSRSRPIWQQSPNSHLQPTTPSTGAPRLPTASVSPQWEGQVHAKWPSASPHLPSHGTSGWWNRRAPSPAHPGPGNFQKRPHNPGSPDPLAGSSSSVLPADTWELWSVFWEGEWGQMRWLFKPSFFFLINVKVMFNYDISLAHKKYWK